MHNLFDCVNNCLLNKENQFVFKEILGLDLMVNFMQGNYLARHLAIKTINFASQANFDNCKYLIEIDALRSIFSYFMGRGMKAKNKKISVKLNKN